jgi:hypothetical protein
MKYTTHNESNTIDTNGTCLQGYINAGYDEITSAFGYPLKEGFDDYKSDAEWLIVFEDGTRATIYNWKDGINYCGEQGTPTEQITDWHIGGFNEKALERVSEVLEGVTA